MTLLSSMRPTEAETASEGQLGVARAGPPTRQGLPRLRRNAAWLFLLGVSLLVYSGCDDGAKLQAPEEPSEVIREAPDHWCKIEAIVTTTDSTETVLFTFTPLTNIPTEAPPGFIPTCVPDLSAYGVELVDPLGVDTPQGNSYWRVYQEQPTSSHTFFENLPSPIWAAIGQHTPPQRFIELDPPARSVEFSYSRLLNASAMWGGVYVGGADSMRVRAMSRIPGTLWYYTYDSKILHSNTPSTSLPYTVWDDVTLSSGNQDRIQWVWFDGNLAMDNLKITRQLPDTTFWVQASCSPNPVTRARNVSCTATWNPSDIPAQDITFDWAFEGDSIRPYPNGTIRYAPPTPITESAAGLIEWAGAAVLSGRVILTGTWEDKIDTDTTTLTVADRVAEFGVIPVEFDATMQPLITDYSKPLSEQTALPYDTMSGVLGINFDLEWQSIDGWHIVKGSPTYLPNGTTGPNAGLWYVGDHNLHIARGWAMRTWISGQEIGSFTYPTEQGVLTARGLLAARRKNDVLKGKKTYEHPDSTALYLGVMAHETMGNGVGKGHQAQIADAASNLDVCGKIPPLIDGLVAADSTTLRDAVMGVLLEGKKAVALSTSHLLVHSNYFNAPYYEVVQGVVDALGLPWGTANDNLSVADPGFYPLPETGCQWPSY